MNVENNKLVELLTSSVLSSHSLKLNKIGGEIGEKVDGRMGDWGRRKI